MQSHRGSGCITTCFWNGDCKNQGGSDMQTRHQHAVSPQQAVTLYGLFLERVKRSPDKVAYRHFDKATNAWVSFTWGEMREQVARWQAALAKGGLGKGDRVALLLGSVSHWGE